MGTLTTVARGAIAGAVGTLAMDLLWYRRYRRDGGDEPFTQWEFTDADDVDEAGAPAQFAAQAADTLHVDLPDERAGTVNDAVHWMTGVANGVAHAYLHGGRNPLLGGTLTGATAIANSYAVLGAMGAYDPVWEYDADTLARDLGAHLVYGITTGLAYAALDGAAE